MFVQLFCQQAELASHALLVVPPFAEELNKSRRMLAMLGHALSQRGVGVMIPDLYGTGDSAGDFKDARWESWLTDLERCAEWLRAEGVQRISILGVRLGAILASEFSHRLGDTCHDMLFWHPVVSGRQALNQFLRLRVAVGMFSGDSKETTTSLLEDLRAGNSLEVAGYELTPELALTLEGKSLNAEKPRIGSSLIWLNVTPRPETAPVGAARQILEDWRDGNVRVHYQAVVGDQFWATQEIAEVPDLIEATCQYVAKAP